MAIWLLERDTDDGQRQFNDSDSALVEAGSAAAARTAADALDPAFPSGWWANATATDISTPGTYDGGLFTKRLNNGVP